MSGSAFVSAHLVSECVMRHVGRDDDRLMVARKRAG